MGLLPSIDVDKQVQQAMDPILQRFDKLQASLDRLVEIEEKRAAHDGIEL